MGEAKRRGTKPPGPPDPGADMADYLRQFLEHREVAHRAMLEPAVELAGQQLELFRPAIAMPGRHGNLTAGLVAHVNGGSGAIPIVLANGSKVFTTTLSKGPPGFDRMGFIDHHAKRVREKMGALAPDSEASAGDMMRTLEAFVDNDGGPPGGKVADASYETTCAIIGLAFGAIPDADRRDVLRLVESSIANDYCIAMVGLFGRGTERGICTTWPILVPLGRYLETVIREHDDREGETIP
jgi:hypothetical protein